MLKRRLFSWRFRLLIALLLLLGAVLYSHIPVSATAGTNEQLNFQARLLTSTGAVVADGTYNIRFKIYQDGTGCVSSGSSPCSGTLKWTETRQNSASQGVVVKNGYFSVNLGSVTAFASSVDWNQDTLWLSLDIGGTSSGGSPTYDGEMLPFKRLTASPYALNADKIDGIDSSVLARTDTTNTFSQNQTVNATLSATTLSSATLQNAGNLAISATGSSQINFQTNGSTRWSVLSTGDLQGNGASTISTSSGDLTLNPSGNTVIVGSSTTSSNAALSVTDSSSNSLLFVRNDGNVGIGTSSPSFKLDVNGSLRTTSTLSVASDAGISGAISVQGVGSIGNNSTSTPGSISLDLQHSFGGSCGISGCYGLFALPYTSVNQGLITGVVGGTKVISSAVASASRGVWANNPTLESGGAVTDNYGVYVSTQTAGTNDYGVYIQGADTTALWVDSGLTKLDGETSIGSVANSNTTITALNVNEDFSGASLCVFGCYGIDSKTTINDAQNLAVAMNAQVVTANSSFTLNSSRGVQITNPNKGASSTITTNSGLYIANQTAGSTDYGIYIQGADTYALFVDAGDTRLDGALSVADSVTIGTSDTTGTLLVLDTDTNTTETSGINGAMYYNSALGQFRCYRDGAWEPCATNPIDRAFLVEEEFISGDTAITNGSVGIGTHAWTFYRIPNLASACQSVDYGGGSGGAAISGDRAGILELQTNGANANYGCRILMGKSTNGTVSLDAGLNFKAAAAVNSTSNVIMRVGADTAVNNTTQSTTGGIWWEADTDTNANWRYCYATGSATTCANSSTAVAANTFVRLEILVTGTGSGTSSATFKINGNSHTVSGVTFGSNPVRPDITCMTTAVATKTCYADYYSLRRDASAQR